MAHESRPPPDATIVMQTSLGARPPAAEKPRGGKRLQFLVQAVDAQWEVTDGATGAKTLHADKQDAILAARAAARGYWTTHGKPTGVTLQEEGAIPFVALYGAEQPE